MFQQTALLSKLHLVKADASSTVNITQIITVPSYKVLGGAAVVRDVMEKAESAENIEVVDTRGNPPHLRSLLER